MIKAFLETGSVVVMIAAVACSDSGAEPGAGGAGGSDVGTGITTGASTTINGSTTTVSSSSSSAGSGGSSEPAFESIPWETGPTVGFGIATKDSQNPIGDSIFIGYAGYAISLDAAESWVTALYSASLRSRGVRHVFAVRGPADPTYSQLEIGNSKIAAALQGLVTPNTHFILVAAHSSGSFVAHELFNELASGFDPANVTQDQIVYFDLDGGQSGLTPSSVDRLRRAYFTSAFDSTTGTYSPNHQSMMSAGAAYAQKGGYFDSDADGAGCQAAATWCLHMTMVTTKPHDPSGADGIPDYSDFAGRPVAHAYIEAKANEAGILP